MTHLDQEIQNLKKTIFEMWKLNILQLTKARQSVVEFDVNLARDVMSNEKRVNAFELKVDRDCEDIFALFNPVAIDLRFVLAVLKINSNLERIGDIADSISRYVIEAGKPFDKELLQKTRMLEMFDISIKMLDDLLVSFEYEDTNMARKIFIQDEMVDVINSQAPAIIADIIQANPANVKECLQVLSIVRKLERLGDQSKNIAEEIIFYVEAKVLKHSGKKRSKE